MSNPLQSIQEAYLEMYSEGDQRILKRGGNMIKTQEGPRDFWKPGNGRDTEPREPATEWDKFKSKKGDYDQGSGNAAKRRQKGSTNKSVKEAYLDMYSEEKKPFPTRKVGDKLNNLEGQWIKANSKEKAHKGMERYTNPEAIKAREDQQKIATRQDKINKVAKANNAMPPRRRKVEEEVIIDYLLDEGFVNNEVSAEVFIEHMSDEWLDSILEGYKDLPVGKMMKKAISRTRREGEAGSRLAREYDSYGPNSSDEKIDKLHKEWDKTQRDAEKNDKMIDVADKHNPYKVQGKEQENKGSGAEWFNGR